MKLDFYSVMDVHLLTCSGRFFCRANYAVEH